MTDGWTAWTEERTEILKKMFAEGDSFALIAARLGISRNAAIGKAARLGLSRDAGPSQKPGRPRCEKPIARQKVTRQAPISYQPLAAATPATPLTGGVTLLDLREHHCKFPFGDPRSEDFRFCGAPKETIIDPYCPAHRMVAYEPSAVRRNQDKKLTKQTLRKIAAR